SQLRGGQCAHSEPKREALNQRWTCHRSEILARYRSTAQVRLRPACTTSCWGTAWHWYSMNGSDTTADVLAHTRGALGTRSHTRVLISRFGRCASPTLRSFAG